MSTAVSQRLWPYLIVVVVLIVGTLAEASISGRFQIPDPRLLNAYAERLDQVPRQIGDWVSDERNDGTVSEKEFIASGAKKIITRIYKNPSTGTEVSLFMVAGTAYHVTVHTPDHCYPAAGFTQENNVNNHVVSLEGDRKPIEFSTARFLKAETVGATQQLHIFWTFSDNGEWHGPQLPKRAYANVPALYKVYLITRTTPEDRKSAVDSAANDFARVFFPAVHDTLFAPLNEEEQANEASKEEAGTSEKSSNATSN